MNWQTMSNWIQTISGIAVLVGLGLVVSELRQGKEIARVQLVSDSMAEFSQRDQAMMGEDASRALAKACDEPDALTTQDMIVLGYYYTEIVNNVRSTLFVSRTSPDIAVFDSKEWNSNFDMIFATEYGKWWWRHSDWEPEIMADGNKVLSAGTSLSCSKHFDSYRNRNKSAAP